MVLPRGLNPSPSAPACDTEAVAMSYQDDQIEDLFLK